MNFWWHKTLLILSPGLEAQMSSLQQQEDRRKGHGRKADLLPPLYMRNGEAEAGTQRWATCKAPEPQPNLPDHLSFNCEALWGTLPSG